MPKGIYDRGEFSKHSHCRSRDLASVFWARVDKLNGPIHPICGQCWVWLGDTTRDYGYFKGVYAHRYAWQLVNGEIPVGLLVLHKCDNERCVNPEHLFLGTHQDNMDDKMSKGRQGNSGTKTPSHGAKNGRAKLTDEIVVKARELKQEGWTVRQIISHLKLDMSQQSALRRAIRGNSWRKT